MDKYEKFNSIMMPLRRFLVSGWYSALLFAGACLFIFTGKEVLGTMVFSVMIAATMFIGDDLLPGIQGILVVTCFAIRLKYSMSDFLKLWPLAIPVVFFFFSHFFLYHKKYRRSALTGGMFATSLAIVIGGVGVIYWKTYFSPTSLFYMCLLGFGMLLIYSYFYMSFDCERDYDVSERFSFAMAEVIPVLEVCLFQEYFERRDEFLSAMSVIPFQWRNNGATMLMLAMPFAFYLSMKKYRYFFLGLLDLVAIVFTGSRGGLLFGCIEFAMCFVWIMIKDKKHRKNNGIIIALGVIALGIGYKYLLDILRYTVERIMDPGENSIRLEMFSRGIHDFLKSPFNGQGLAYMGNRDVHASAKHTLCWYHCSFIQVPASFGIVGIIAYIYLNIQRVKVYLKNRNHFTSAMFFSFIGLEMMSLVNPGIFVPFPYLFLVTAYFAIMETQKNESIINR